MNLFYSYDVKSGIGQGSQDYNDISFMLRATPLMPIYGSDGNYYDWDDFEKSSLAKLSSGFVNPIAEMVYLRGNNINKVHNFIYGSDGNYYDWDDFEKSSLAKLSSGFVNPIAEMVYLRGNNINKVHNFNVSPYLSVTPIEGLTLKSQFGYKVSANSYRQYYPKYELNRNNSRFKDNSYVSQSMSTGWGYTWENTINYQFNINNHNIDALVGQSMEKTGMGESITATNKDLLFEGMDYAWLSNAQSKNPTASGSPWLAGRLMSFFGRVNYNYNETYMLSLIIRYDGSSNFAPGNRWGTFPSISAGWVISNEKFMKSLSGWLDFLKIRASWGQNGNCNISPFQYLSTIAFDSHSGYSFGNVKDSYSQGAYPDILPNPSVTWETSEQTNIGIDARFFNQRLGFIADWYIKKTKDWLVQAPILDSFGTNAPFINGGDVENRGLVEMLKIEDLKSLLIGMIK